ncbi:MAG: major capsid protein [Vicinamibacterales bacterium]
MALTLIEAAKLETGNVFRSAIIELYAGSSMLMQVMPFTNIAGNALKYNREGNLPGVGFRGVNEAFSASTGVLNPLTEPLVIAGGDLDVDRFILQTMGMNQRSVQEAMKVRALGLMLTRKVIKGDQTSDPREFDGLQTRLIGNQLIAAGATANGTALSLAKLDEAIDQTLNPTHLIMNKSMARKLTVAARTAAVAGNIDYSIDQFGKRVMAYNGIPIITLDLDGDGTAILPFTEAATSGTATATSIYVVSFGGDGVVGLQNGGIDVRDMGELQTAPVYRTRVEWFMGMAIFNGRAATRLYSIADAAVTA